MAGFISNKIVRGRNLGEKLREARLDLGISLEKASKDLSIAYKYLLALEENKLSDLPGRTYVKNFLRSYCQYLKLNFSDCWRAAKDLEDLELVRKGGILNRKNFFVWSKLVRRLAIILAILMVVVFLLWKVEEIFAPPKLEIIQPRDGSVVQARQIEIIGQSQPEVEITINNKNVFIDKNGKFITEADLQKGLNLIKISAKKRYSRTQEATVRVLLEEADGQ